MGLKLFLSFDRTSHKHRKKYLTATLLVTLISGCELDMANSLIAAQYQQIRRFVGQGSSVNGGRSYLLCSESRLEKQTLDDNALDSLGAGVSCR